MDEQDWQSTIETRLTAVEVDLTKLRKTVHDINGEQQIMVGQMTDLQKDIAKVLTFFEGTDKIFGFCRKHWRTALKFGCGVVTAYGVSNPHVQATVSFIGKFFGI